MSHINVTINGRQYRMACEEGQEMRLLRLADELDGSLVKSRKLERANREIAEKLDAAIGTIRAVLGEVTVDASMREEAGLHAALEEDDELEEEDADAEDE